MKRFLTWLGRNVDPLLAVFAAAVVVVLDLASEVPPETVSSGILFVLGVLSVAVLRDRARSDETEQQLREEVQRAAAVAPALAALTATVNDVVRTLDDATMVRVVSGPEVAAALADARRTTDRWIFRGGTGTYIRAKTLPDCVEHARQHRRQLQMRLEIIDPTNEKVCASYVRFRHSFSGDQSDWTVERTQRESYATIVAACWHRQRYELLDVEIGLSQIMPTLRWDLSAQCLIITQESQHKPALLIRHDKLLYAYLYTELRKSLEQARPVPLNLAGHILLGVQPTVDEIRRLFRALDMPLPNTFTDDDVADIVDRALNAKDPYGP
jgi:hypothetical protein